METTQSRRRSRDEMGALRDAQIKAHKELQKKARSERLKNFETLRELRGDMAELMKPPDLSRAEPRRRDTERPRRRTRTRSGLTLER